MSIRYATEEEIATWNEHIAANPGSGNVLQGREFMEIKARAGWTIRYVMIDARAAAVMEKYVFPLGKVWYVPKGPSTTSVDDLDDLLSEFVPFAKKHGVISIKVEPELDYRSDLSPLVTTYRLHKTNPIQYNFSTVLVDLSPDLETIMKNLPQKGRHAIRRAERDGVTVQKVEPTNENCQIMYDLFRETANDAHFAIRPAEYYQQFYRQYGDNGGLFFAYFEGTPVAGAFAMVQGKKSMYKDGASVRERTAYGASHLLQWKVIEWAKSKGSKEHDLAGVPPIAHIHDTTHPFYGMGRFKTSFNKTVTEYVGAYNIPVARLRGVFWDRFWEKVVRRLYFKFRGQAWY
ncbi:peptidoglycan bridge formation glycyltransferase FemA/FemB family protein [Candidatus Saccharibacteria bacterium]|nr:peptidoglycan bridge formation glycyltransferase FemA/FemB family protein [Candidatus Saccharibacteria bacterium]